MSTQVNTSKEEECNVAEKMGWHYKSELVSYVRKFLSDQSEVDDIVQETYLRLTKHPPDPAQQEKLKAYIFVVAANLVKDRLRRKVTHSESHHIQLETKTLLNETDTPESSAISEQLKGSLVNGLKALPKKYRQVFVMQRFMHLSNRQIANRLGISVRTVERRMVYALDHLRSQLRDYL